METIWSAFWNSRGRLPAGWPRAVHAFCRLLTQDWSTGVDPSSRPRGSEPPLGLALYQDRLLRAWPFCEFKFNFNFLFFSVLMEGGGSEMRRNESQKQELSFILTLFPQFSDCIHILCWYSYSLFHVHYSILFYSYSYSFLLLFIIIESKFKSFHVLMLYAALTYAVGNNDHLIPWFEQLIYTISLISLIYQSGQWSDARCTKRIWPRKINK